MSVAAVLSRRVPYEQRSAAAATRLGRAWDELDASSTICVVHMDNLIDIRQSGEVLSVPVVPERMGVRAIESAELRERGALAARLGG